MLNKFWVWEESGFATFRIEMLNLDRLFCRGPGIPRWAHTYMLTVAVPLANVA